MQEVVIVTSSKDLGGIGIVDVSTGSNACSTFKNCIADSGTVCMVGGLSSFSGCSAYIGDYIVVAQSKKPVIQAWTWGKPQVHMQCHLQEIITSLACDVSSTYLFGGSKKGYMFVWEISTGRLLLSWQAHFKEVTRLVFTLSNEFCLSCSADGMARVWDLSLVDELTGSHNSEKKSITPYRYQNICESTVSSILLRLESVRRTWSPHSLPIKDAVITGSFVAIRALTCSIDRAVTCYDVHGGRQLFRIGLPQPLESLASSCTCDFIFAGASNGVIFILDISVAAINASAANAVITHAGAAGAAVTDVAAAVAAAGVAESKGSMGGSGPQEGFARLEGHSKAVTSLACSADNCTLVSGSEDGTLRLWDIWTRQCLRELKPLNKLPISNVKIVLRPEHIGAGTHKPSLAPFEHLQKFSEAAVSSAGPSAGYSGGADQAASLVLGASFYGRQQQPAVASLAHSPDDVLKHCWKHPEGKLVMPSAQRAADGNAAKASISQGDEGDFAAAGEEAAIAAGQRGHEDEGGEREEEPVEEFIGLSGGLGWRLDQAAMDAAGSGGAGRRRVSANRGRNHSPSPHSQEREQQRRQRQGKSPKSAKDAQEEQSATLGGREAAAEAGQQGLAAAAELAGLRDEAGRWRGLYEQLQQGSAQSCAEGESRAGRIGDEAFDNSRHRRATCRLLPLRRRALSPGGEGALGGQLKAREKRRRLRPLPVAL